MWMFRNSKYVQSKIGETYKQVRDFLKEGRLVLYSGTPCQLEGLFQFLRNKSYENLYTVDVVCRAVPSPLVLRKYLEMQKNRLGGTFKNVMFRDKHYGYAYSSMSIETEEGLHYHEGIDTDPYLRAFFSEISVRPSCVECKFRKRYRETDITIWDCFDIARYSKKMNNDKGATKVLAHTEKGKSIMSEIEDRLNVVKTDPAQILLLNGHSEINVVLTDHPKRKQFFEDLNKLPSRIVFDKYFPMKFKNRIEKRVRIMTYQIGLYNLVKKVYIFVVGRDNIKR